MSERWIVERTRDHLWIGTPKPDALGGEKVDEVVVGICISGMTQQALDRAIADAELIASAPTLRDEVTEYRKTIAAYRYGTTTRNGRKGRR